MANTKVSIDLLLEDNKFKQSIDNNKKAVSSFAKGFASLAAGGAILTGIGSKAIQVGMDFENSFAKVKTLLPDVGIDLKNLENNMLDLSVETALTTNELNEGLYQALSAGIPVTEDMGEATDFLATAAKLARGGFTTLDKAVDAATSVMNAYGLGVENAEEIMDNLIMTQNLGKVLPCIIAI